LYVSRVILADARYSNTIQIAGFCTGGALAIRGGYKAARNGAISCAILLAVIEGVGIGFQKMFAGATKLEVSPVCEWWLVLVMLTLQGPATTAFKRDETRIEALTISELDDGFSTNSTPLLRPLAGPGVYFLYAFMTVSIMEAAFPGL
jgi:hypothetical protein